jgi:hypothetical protein
MSRAAIGVALLFTHACQQPPRDGQSATFENAIDSAAGTSRWVRPADRR